MLNIVTNSSVYVVLGMGGPGGSGIGGRSVGSASSNPQTSVPGLGTWLVPPAQHHGWPYEQHIEQLGAGVYAQWPSLEYPQYPTPSAVPLGS